MVELTKVQFEAAKAAGEARMRGPRAESAHYDSGHDRIIIRLTTGIEIGVPPREVEGLQNATLDDLNSIEIEAFGLGIHFPTIDADLYVPALLEGGRLQMLDGCETRRGWRAQTHIRQGGRLAGKWQARWPAAKGCCG